MEKRQQEKLVLLVLRREKSGGRALVPAVRTVWWDSGHPQQEESITAEGFSLCHEAGAGRWLSLEA